MDREGMLAIIRFRFHPPLSHSDCSFAARLLDRALAALHRLAAKYELPILGTRRQPPPKA